MAQHKSPPIFSSREDDPSQSEAIDQFVIVLAEKVDRLQDAELDGNFEQLGEYTTDLGQQAEELGYHPLAEIAATVADACRDNKVEDAEAAMVELTEISGRIRRGHRGSA